MASRRNATRFAARAHARIVVLFSVAGSHNVGRVTEVGSFPWTRYLEESSEFIDKDQKKRYAKPPETMAPHKSVLYTFHPI